MLEDDILVLRGSEVQALLDGRERELLDIVRAAYLAHGRGESSLPHSTFLKFPGESRNRIIALPAYVGAEFDVAGVKWIASFPDNLNQGKARASAVVILNSLQTGQAEAIIEGSLISAKRTAAGAALASRYIADRDTPQRVAVVGCGLINFEIVRFLQVACPWLKDFCLFDLSPVRAADFKERCERTFNGLTVEVAANLNEALSRGTLVSLATTAIDPHLREISAFRPGAAILHISLRDLTPEIILAADNIVDDADHVCRARTSVHLAEQLTGNRNFIRCTLSDLLTGAAPPRMNKNDLVIFSPFGLGVLDLAVGKFVHDLGIEQGRGTVIESFLPGP